MTIPDIIAANRRRIIRSRAVIYVRGDFELRDLLNNAAKRLGCSANELAMAALQAAIQEVVKEQANVE